MPGLARSRHLQVKRFSGSRGNAVGCNDRRQLRFSLRDRPAGSSSLMSDANVRSYLGSEDDTAPVKRGAAYQ